MGLYIEGSDLYGVGRWKQEWHVGELFPVVPIGIDQLTVRADGHELEHITSNFAGLPVAPPKQRVVTYTGDFAWFIVNNI